MLNRMASKYLLGAAFMSCMLLTSGVAQATSDNCTYADPGDFQSLAVDTAYCGNDPFGGQGGYINNTPSLVKWTPPSTEEEGIAAGDYADDISVTSLGTSGTWTWTHDENELYPQYVLYKAGSGFFISLVTDLTDVTWSTVTLLGGHAISHISWYNHGTPPGGGIDPIPVPAAFPLLLSALGGLTWLSRRRRKTPAA
ncbi:MAG TPA: VPLPA-CTERM sorting domain-containing protein [Aestuariivirga sp.]|nr:VPLPA-CTERM sorting domain-containing protein [Aestuariivirga sp.]